MNAKVWLIPVYLLIGASGIAGVMALEAQLIKVTAEVSNSVTVPTQNVVLGGAEVFPKEWHTATTTVGLSTSFTGQSRVSSVAYTVCAAPKPSTYPNPTTGFSFLWMGGASFLQVEGDPAWYWIGDTRTITPPAAGFVCPGAGGTLHTSINTSDVITIGLDVPTFQGETSPTTPNLPRPDNAICVPEPAVDVSCVDIPVPPGDPLGIDLGTDLIIQVTAIREPVTVSIGSPASVTSGNAFTAQVDVTQITNFDAGQFDVTFDNTVLRLDSVTGGNIGGTAIPVTGTNPILPDAGAGTVTVLVNVPGTPGVSGIGYLAGLNFTAIGAASTFSTVNLSNVVLSNNAAQQIPSAAQGATVNVQ